MFHGQSSYAFNLISGFDRKSIDYTLFYADMPKMTRYSHSKKASYRLFGLPLINENIKDRIINMKVSRYDILHCLTNCGMPLGRSKAKKIVTLHDVIPFRHPEFYSEYTLSYIIKGIKETLRIADGVITISEFSKKDICELFDCDSSKIYVVYIGIDNNVFSKKDAHRIIPEEYILFIGGLHPRKGLDFLLKAFKTIKEQVPHKLVLIDNKGWKDSRIHKIINEYNLSDRVVLKKAYTTDEMVSYYSSAALLVFPSLYEGFGLPPLEAMACGCPVVTSNNSSLRELYEGVALLVDPKDIKGMSDKILEVLIDTELRNRMIENGLSLSIKLNMEKTVQSTLDVYEKVLKCKWI